MLFPSAIMWIVFGSVSAYMARRRGKNPYLWFLLGTFFGVFGLLFLYFGPKDKKAGAQTHARNADPTPTIDITPNISPDDKQKFWYYLDPQNSQQGPMSFDGLMSAYRENRVSGSTYVWCENYDCWKLFGDLV